MSSTQEQSRFGRPGLTVLGGLALTVLLTLFALWTVSEQASGESNRRVVLGATKDKVTPNCGTRAGSRVCKAEGKITGYQVFQRGHEGRNFVVPFRRGKVIAWSISLSNPTRRDTEKFGAAQFPYFNGLFGSPSRAGISVLRQTNKGKKGNPRFRLIRRSGVQTLNPYFGRTVRFALIQPLNVARGDVVALTIPTWAPAFWAPYACSVAGPPYEARCAAARKNNTWRGSRESGKCVLGTDAMDRPNEALRDSRPQQKLNSNRLYGCYYGASRMLYTATVVAR